MAAHNVKAGTPCVKSQASAFPPTLAEYSSTRSGLCTKPSEDSLGASGGTQGWVGESAYFLFVAASTPGGSSDFTNCPLAPLYSRTIPSSPPAATTAPSGLAPTA